MNVYYGDAHQPVAHADFIGYSPAASPTFHTPSQQNFDSEEMRGSIQKILSDNLGEYGVIEFLIGTERLMRKQGILYFVGTSYVTLYDDTIKNYIVCDLYSIKFVYFYLPGQKPKFNYNHLTNNPRQPHTR